MSFVTFDYECSRCKFTEERFVKRSEVEDQECPACYENMRRLPAPTRTTFRHADERLKK